MTRSSRCDTVLTCTCSVLGGVRAGCRPPRSRPAACRRGRCRAARRSRARGPRQRATYSSTSGSEPTMSPAKPSWVGGRALARGGRARSAPPRCGPPRRRRAGTSSAPAPVRRRPTVTCPAGAIRGAAARGRPAVGSSGGHERDDVTVVRADERARPGGGVAESSSARARRARSSARAPARRTASCGSKPLRPGPGRAARRGSPRPRDEVGDQVGADPLLGVGGLPLEEQDEGRDHGGPLDRAPVGVVQRSARPSTKTQCRAAVTGALMPTASRRRRAPAGRSRAASAHARVAARRRRGASSPAAAPAMLGARRRTPSSTAQPPSSSASACVMSSTPPPPSTRAAKRSWAAAARSTPAVCRRTVSWASDSAARAFSASRRGRGSGRGRPRRGSRGSRAGRPRRG